MEDIRCEKIAPRKSKPKFTLAYRNRPYTSSVDKIGSRLIRFRDTAGFACPLTFHPKFGDVPLELNGSAV